jgi:hypothetical protein
MAEESSTQASSDGTTAIVVRNTNGKDKILLKDSSGRFVKKPKIRGNSKEINDAMRKVLTTIEADPLTGKLTKNSKNHIVKMTLNMARIAEYDGEDPKSKSAAVQAYTAVMNRAYGMPNKSDEEREDNKLQGVKIVVIQQPELMHPEIVQIEDRLSLPSKPSFIDGEVVSTDSPKE